MSRQLKTSSFTPSKSITNAPTANASGANIRRDWLSARTASSTIRSSPSRIARISAAVRSAKLERMTHTDCPDVGLGCSSGNGPARGRTVRRGLFDAALLADPHGVHDQAGYEPQDDEIEEHLECDDHPGGLTLCCDVTESDRREDRG